MKYLFAALMLAVGGCGGEVTSSVVRPPPKPPPLNVTATLSDTIISGDECRFLLRFQANDSSRTVVYSWDVDVFQSLLPGVGGFTGGASGSFIGRYEHTWQWQQPTAADTFILNLSYSLESESFNRFGGLIQRCP